MTRSNRYQRVSAGVTVRQVSDGLILLDMRSSSYYSLAGVGALVWANLAEPTTLQQMTEVVLDAFADAERELVAADVSTFVHDLVDSGLAVVVES